MISNEEINMTKEFQKNQQYISSDTSNSSDSLNGNGSRTSYQQQHSMEYRFHKPLTTTQTVDAAILHTLFGWTGALHFYLGRYKMGFIYLFTFGLLGIGYIYDFFRFNSLLSEYNNNKVNSPINPFKIDEAYLFWLSFGWIGGHHFYLGNYGRGIFYLFTLGGLGVLFIIDLFLMPQLVKEASMKIQSTTDLVNTSNNNLNSSATTHHNNNDNTLIIKSTTIYTSSNQAYTTNTQTILIPNQNVIVDIPYAYTINSTTLFN